MARRPLDRDALHGLSAPWALVGARVWTGEEGVAEGDAIAFGASGRVLACGGRTAVLAKLPPGADVVEADGSFVCPGFVDPHVHVRAAASARTARDVSGAVDGGAIVAAVKHAARGHGSWITLVGSELDSPLTGRAPHRRELDRASRGRPVRVRTRNGHGWLFNSAGLRRLGVDVVATPGRRERDPAGVAVERDHAGVATGFVADHVGWVRSRLGRVTAEQQLREAGAAWSRELALRGVVAICDATATNGAAEAELLVGLRRDGALRQEVTFLSAPEAVVSAAARKRHAGVKFADASDPRLAQALRVARSRGHRVAVHCLEPHETAAALQAAMTVPEYARGALRIEHAAFVAPDWIPDVVRARASVVTHPSFVAERGDAYLADPALTPSEWVYPVASWTRAGVPLAFASDAPFGDPDPLAALRAAASRTTASGRHLARGEALTGEPALRAVTSEAARIAGLDRFGYGRLARGGPGAAVVLSGDPRDPWRLAEVELVATVIGGRVVR